MSSNESIIWKNHRKMACSQVDMNTSDAEFDYFTTVDFQGDDSSSTYGFDDEKKSSEEDAADSYNGLS